MVEARSIAELIKIGKASIGRYKSDKINFAT